MCGPPVMCKILKRTLTEKLNYKEGEFYSYM
mgnify:CR=1 FL=1